LLKELGYQAMVRLLGAIKSCRALMTLVCLLAASVASAQSFESLLQKIKQTHERLWARETLSGDELKAFRQEFSEAEHQLAFIRGQIQKEILEFSLAEDKLVDLESTSNIATKVFLYFRSVTALGTVKAQILTSDPRASLRESMDAYALFIPYDLYWKLGVTSEVEGTNRQDYYSSYIVTPYSFEGASGVRLSVNPAFLLSAEVQYLFRREISRESILLLYKYIAYRNLSRQWRWNNLLLNQSDEFKLSKANSVAVSTSLDRLHSLPMLEDMQSQNDELLLQDEAKKLLIQYLKSVFPLSQSLVGESLKSFVTNEWLPPDATAEYEAAVLKRLEISQAELFYVFEGFLKNSAIPFEKLPDDELRASVNSIIARSYAGLAYQKTMSLYSDMQFGESDDLEGIQKLSLEDVNQINLSILSDQSEFMSQLSWSLDLHPKNFGLSGIEKYPNFRALVLDQKRQRTFEVLIKTSVDAAVARGTLKERFAATIETLKLLTLQNIESKSLVVPKAMNDLFASFVFIQNPLEIKMGYEAALKELKENQSKIATAEAESKEQKHLRHLNEQEFSGIKSQFQNDLKAWEVLAGVFGFSDGRFEKIQKSGVVLRSPEELLRHSDSEVSAHRFGLQKDQLAVTKVSMFPILNHKVVSDHGREPLYLHIAKMVRRNATYKEIVRVIGNSAQLSQKAITKNAQKIEDASSMSELDDLARSPTLSQEVNYLFPEFGIIQRHWIDDLVGGNFHKRYYEDSIQYSHKFILMPLLAMMAFEFMRDGTSHQAGRPGTMTLRKAAFQNWKDAIHPVLWTMIIGNLIYRDSQSLYQYGLGYKIEADWGEMKFGFVQSNKNRDLEELFASSSIGNALVDINFYQSLRAEYIQNQVVNHVVLAWDAILATILLRPRPNVNYRNQSASGQSGGGGGVREPRPPGPEPTPPSKLQIDLKTGEIRGIQ
jgi:hypothetical protein